VTISPIAARAKDESESRFGKSAGEIVGSIVPVAIPAVVRVVVVASRRAIVVVTRVSRSVIIVVLIVVIPPPLVIVVIMVIPSMIRCAGRVGVTIPAARKSESCSDQHHYSSDYKIFQKVPFHGRSPVVIGSV
jgi:hypothetical protein